MAGNYLPQIDGDGREREREVRERAELGGSPEGVSEHRRRVFLSTSSR
jgi:hypothetical protein